LATVLDPGAPNRGRNLVGGFILVAGFLYGYTSKLGFGHFGVLLALLGLIVGALQPRWALESFRLHGLFFGALILMVAVHLGLLTYHSESRTAYNYLSTFATAPLVYLGLAYLRPSPTLLATCFFLCSLLAGGFSISEAINAGGVVRVHGPYGLPIVWGQACMVAGILSLVFALHYQARGEIHKATILATSSLGGLIGSLLTGSKFTWLSAAFLYLPLLLYFTWHSSRKIKATLLVSIVTCGAFLTLHPSSSLTPRLLQAIESVKLGSAVGHYNDGSIGARAAFWRYGIEAIQSAPLVGIGREAIVNDMADLSKSRDLAGFIGGHVHLHNELLDMTLQMGLLGSLLFVVPLFTIAFPWLAVLRGGGPWVTLYPAIGLAIMASFFLYSLSDHLLIYSAARNLFVIGLVIALLGPTAHVDKSKPMGFDLKA